MSLKKHLYYCSLHSFIILITIFQSHWFPLQSYVVYFMSYKPCSQKCPYVLPAWQRVLDRSKAKTLVLGGWELSCNMPLAPRLPAAHPASIHITAKDVAKPSAPDTPLFQNPQWWKLTFQKWVNRCLEELFFFPGGGGGGVGGEDFPALWQQKLWINESSWAAHSLWFLFT